MKTTIPKFIVAICALAIPFYGICQVSIPSNTYSVANDFVGWNSTVGSPPLNIKTELAQPINFYTFAGPGGINNLRMTIFDDPLSPFNAGFVGIGSNLATYNPLFNLDVLSTINVNNDGNPINALGIGYFIGGNMVLQVPGTRNTFGGVNAGSSWTSGQDNTFYGNNAGNQNNIGRFNTFIGSNAGSANDEQYYNTYVGNLSGTNNMGSSNSFFGHHSGFNTIGGDFNTFIGEHAGFGSTTTPPTGSYNTFVGNSAGEDYVTARDNALVGNFAGQSIFSGSENAFLGNLAGRFNTLGSRNTFLGFRAGQNNIFGTDLTLVGHLTFAQATPAISNATAIGASASVVTNNTMILGQNNVNVGIGLSGITPGPQNKLEINDIVNFGSGLTFRQLTSASVPTFPSNGRVLTVDGSGTVVLTDDVGGNGSVTACGGLTSAHENYITKWRTITGTSNREICRTESIYESPTSPFAVGVGIGPATINNAFKLQMSGDFLIQQNATSGGDIYMESNSGIERVFGVFGLFHNRSMALGPQAGPVNLQTAAADGCTYVGRLSGSNTVNNSFNTFVGHHSGLANTIDANKNTFIGAFAALDLTNGDHNTIMGYNSALSFTRGSANTFLGSYAGSISVSSGMNNTMLGASASTNYDGDNNVIIGANANGTNNQVPGFLTNAVTIGYNARVECDNCFTIASQDPFYPQQQVGIGVRNPFTTIIPTAPTGAQAKLYVSSFNGGTTSAYFNGEIYASAFTTTSDSMLKDNILSYTDASTIIDQLEAKTFTYKHSAFPSLNLPSGTQIGFIAQDIEPLAPQLVSWVSNPAEYDTAGNVMYPQVDFKSVNYSGLIPILFTAIKQQKMMIDSLAQVVSQITISPLINTPPSGNRSSINISNKAIVVLNQNAPNPFNDKTEISYHIPESVASAIIMFYDASGRVLQKFDIEHRGQGSLTVFGEDLSSGTYSYTLLLDGKNYQTKKMVKH